MRELRRSTRSRLLFDELTMELDDQAIHRAIATLSQSDPLVKLVQQVRVGRMQPTDPGLRAVTESWLSTYSNVVSDPRLSRTALRRIDPKPRVIELIHAGIMSSEHPTIAALQANYERAYASAAD